MNLLLEKANKYPLYKNLISNLLFESSEILAPKFLKNGLQKLD